MSFISDIFGASPSSNKQANYSANTFLLRPMWFAAGADPYLLKKGTYSDQVKMACMGGTVYATALLAFISGSYAIRTIFFPIDSESLWPYAMGVVWALIIFNLDRFIVSSTPANIGKSSWTKWKQAIPRILMGLIISFVISKPIEIKIFEKDIKERIEIESLNGMAVLRDTEFKKNTELKAIELKKDDYKRKYDEAKNELNNITERYNLELEGKNSGNMGVGPIARDFKRQVDAKEKQVIEVNESIDNEEKKYADQKEIIEAQLEKKLEIITASKGSFVNQLRLAHEISPVISWSLTILFVVLELTPIIFKLMMERAPYDFQMYDRDEVIKSKSTVIEEGAGYISRNAKQVEEERIREITAKDYVHTEKVEEDKRQDLKKIEIDQQVFDSNIAERTKKSEEVQRLDLENNYNSNLNSKINHEQQEMLLANLQKRKEYITQLEELERFELERNLLKNAYQQQILSQEEIEVKKVSNMKDNEMDRLIVDREYQKQLLDLDRDYNVKKLKIYNELLDKKSKEESTRFEKEYDARKNNEVSHAQEMNKIKNGVVVAKGNQSKPMMTDNKKNIADALVDGRYYAEGDDYAYVKILSRDTIRDITSSKGYTENKIDILYNSEDNCIATAGKITQFKKGKGLLETVIEYKGKMGDNGINYSIDKAKALDIEARNIFSK